MLDKLRSLIPRGILMAARDISHPTKRGWRIFEIYNNPNVRGRFEYEGQKGGPIEQKGLISLTFYEDGKRVMRWNTHGRQDVTFLHRDDLLRKKKEIPFRKNPSISRIFLQQLDKASPEELRKIRQKYE